MNPHIGSDFDDFLHEEGIFEEVEAAALKKVVACMVAQAMEEKQISKSEMARRMKTSRQQLARLLDFDGHYSVSLATLMKAAAAVGKKVSISFESVEGAA